MLTDFSPDNLAKAIERNGVECCLSWAGWPEMELHHEEHFVRTITDVPFPFFNNVFYAQLPEGDVDSAIQAAIGPFRRRKVPAFWWTGPTTRPADLGRHLERAGLEHAFEASAMAVHLDAMNEAKSPPGGLVVEEVVDEAGLRDWCWVMTPIYEFPGFAADAWLTMLGSLGLGADKTFRHYLARLDGKPVATASLYLAAGVAGISSVGTIPDYRHRGIGSAVTFAALREARQLGCRIGVLFSSVMGEKMYRRIGFEEYGKGNCYAWTPE